MADKIPLIDRLLGRDTTLIESYEAQLSKSQAVNDAQALEVGRLQESMRELSLWLEDLNWTPIAGWQEYEGFSLDAIRRESDRIQSLLTVNPTIKKAVNARIGYIWSRGVKIEGSGIKKIMSSPYNARSVFSKQAQTSLEMKLATDGNLWAARNVRNDEITIVPITRIAGWILDERDPSRVNYWLVRYTITVKNFRTGVESVKEVEEFYPAHDYTGPKTATNIDGIKINREYQMVHLAVNRQQSWILGVPDVMAAMFWAKAHKELFESGTTYVKAQGKFASKVIAKNELGGQQAAATLRDAPRRDPDSGEILDAGGTAVLTGGLDYQLMGKMTGGVDFDNFDPVAGLVAAGLGVPLRVLLGDAEQENQSLEQSTVDEMRMRQEVWSWFFQAVLGSNRNVKVVWPKIKTEPEYRRLQSVEIANRTHTLSRQELRMLTLEGFDIEGDPSELPKYEDHPDVIIERMKAEVKAENDDTDSGRSTTPERGNDQGIGKLSTGSDAKDARDNPLDGNVKPQ